MGVTQPVPALPPRPRSWKWCVCGLLLLATMINYMDRLTLNTTAKRIKDDLQLTNEDYGNVESAFGVAFALGCLAAGWSADRWNVRWLYAGAVLGWSAAGLLTGFARSLEELLVCRFLLGLFEAGNWACALRTTQRILLPAERTLGNSLLQSGAAIGAIFTPLIVELLLTDNVGSWRAPFLVIGALGSFWTILWLWWVKADDLALDHHQKAPINAATPALSARERQSLYRIYCQPRFLALVLLVVAINLTWHFFRVWMPLFLREGRDYNETEVNLFTSLYYAASDAGSLSAGFATLWLARRGMRVHWTRATVYLFCALLTCLSVAVASVPKGPLLLALLLVIGFGALGLFPPYYSLSQELTTRHQGKVTGVLGFTTWIVSAVMHHEVGKWLDRTQDYATAVAVAGLFPLLAFGGLLLLWRTPPKRTTGPEAFVRGSLANASGPESD